MAILTEPLRRHGSGCTKSTLWGRLLYGGGVRGRDIWGDPQYLDPVLDVHTKAEWLSAGRWVRGRAGTDGKTTIEIDGKVEKSRSMKGVDSALMSDAEVGVELKTLVREQFHVMEKSEGGKSRPVVKTSNESSRKMDFLSEVVEKGLYSTRFSTLYAGTAGNNAIDAELLELTRNPNYIKVPLVQKNWMGPRVACRTGG